MTYLQEKKAERILRFLEEPEVLSSKNLREEVGCIDSYNS